MSDGKCETASREELLADRTGRCGVVAPPGQVGGDGGFVMPPTVAHGTKAFTLGHELLALAADQSEWSQATFGTDAERGPVGAWRHLQKECGETIEAWEKLRAAIDSGESDEVRHELAKKVAVEVADQLLLWLDANRRSGLTILEVVKAAQEKMKINRTRRYARTPDGVPAEHDRSGEVAPASWWRRAAAVAWAGLVRLGEWDRRHPGLLYLLASVVWFVGLLLLLFAK